MEARGLIYSSKNGDLDIVKLLLKSGADVNRQNNSGNTALVLASNSGHDKTVKMLVAAGADVNIQNLNGTTALMLAAHFRNQN